MSGHATWLTPSGEAWEKVFGAGSFSYTMAAGLFGKLKKNGVTGEEMGERLTRYLAETPPRFVSLARFVATWGAWGEPEGPTFTVDDAGVIRE